MSEEVAKDLLPGNWQPLFDHSAEDLIASITGRRTVDVRDTLEVAKRNL